VVVEARELLERAAPVRQIGFVPELPLETRDSFRVTPLHVGRVRCDEGGPLVVVLRRVEAPAVEAVGVGIFVRVRSGRQVLRHEAELDERKGSSLRRRVHDLVDERVVVDGVLALVLGVDVGRAPFEFSGAVTGVEEKVRADVNGSRICAGKRAEEVAGLRCRRGVRFVVAEVRPHALERLTDGRPVDRDGHDRFNLGVRNRAERQIRNEGENERLGFSAHGSCSRLGECLHRFAFDGEPSRVAREVLGETGDIARIRRHRFADALRNPSLEVVGE